MVFVYKSHFIVSLFDLSLYDKLNEGRVYGYLIIVSYPGAFIVFDHRKGSLNIYGRKEKKGE